MQGKLKVAFYVGDLPATTFINRLASGLFASGVDLTMFGLIKHQFTPPKGVKISGPKDGYKEGRFSRYLRYLKYSFLMLLFKRKEKRKIDQWLKDKGNIRWNDKTIYYPIIWIKPDILHVQWAKDIHHFGWTHLLNIKLVLSLRGAQINYSPLTTPGLAQKYQAVFPEINGFHGVSKAICLEAAKYGADVNKCRVIYSGFNLDQFPIGNWQNDFKSLSKRPVKIISVGRAHWKKGYHYALDAIAMLKKEGVSFNYSIIGAVGSEELLFQRNQLDLENEVSILNNVSFNEVKQLISAADIMLLSSLEEGIANVVIEAMLLGTLVITTDCGGMTETVTHGQTGWVVPISKPEALTQAVIEIKNTSPDTLEKIVFAARQKAEEQHNEERMASEMIILYNSILVNDK